MSIIKLQNVELYYEEFGQGDRYVIQAQQFVNSYVYYTIDLADHGFHVYIIRLRGYAPSTMVTEDLGDDWYDVWLRMWWISPMLWELINSFTPVIPTAQVSAGICV